MVKQSHTAGQQRPRAETSVPPTPGRRGDKEGCRGRRSSGQRYGVAGAQLQKQAGAESPGRTPAGGRGNTVAYRLGCYRCGCPMEFDPGSRFVQCYKCFAINAALPSKEGGRRHDGVEVLGVICPGCLTTNLVSSRARLVRCNMCSTISAAPGYAAAASASSPAPAFPRELSFF